MSNSIFRTLDKNLKTSETETNLLVESQSYLQKISNSSNQLAETTKNSCFQVNLVDTGTIALMQLSYWTTTIASETIRYMDECCKKNWNCELSIEDRKRINTRVVGYDGLTIPDKLEGEY